MACCQYLVCPGILNDVIQGSTEHARLSIYWNNKHDLIGCLNVFKRQSTCDFTKWKRGSGWLLVLTFPVQWRCLSVCLTMSRKQSPRYEPPAAVWFDSLAGKWLQPFLAELELSLNSACGSGFIDFCLEGESWLHVLSTYQWHQCWCCANMRRVELKEDQTTAHGFFFTLYSSLSDMNCFSIYLLTIGVWSSELYQRKPMAHLDFMTRQVMLEWSNHIISTLISY